MDTEISRIKSRICVIIIIKIKEVEDVSCPDLPNRERSKCPAIMFAESRMARVNGRIISLMDSIITINGIKIKGVPWGVRWAKRSFIKFNILNIMILVHKVRERERENLKCLDAVKINGKRPRKLLKKIINRSLVKIIRLEKEKEIKFLNSLKI